MMMTSNTTQGTSTATSGTTFIATFSDNNPSVHEAVTGSTTEKIMIFRATGVSHTFTVPSGGLNCDILMIGGGGGSGSNGAAGAGACIVAINHTIPAGSCVVNVGAGDGGGNNGYNSYITVGGNDRYLAKGGGGSVSNGNFNGSQGGCGGGSAYQSSLSLIGGPAVSTNIVNGVSNIGPTSTTTYSVMGNNGGGNNSSYSSSGGGGGIGEPGATPGVGGNGRYDKTINGTTINFRNYFANGGNSFGVLNSGDGQYYIGGGGGGVLNGSYQAGGLGGGGTANAGVANTGGGGTAGSAGGSGIVIIRYRTGTTYTHTPTSTTTLSTTLGTPSIELVRGTQGDSNTDYKLGNYDGNFIVKSSVSGVDSDYIRMLGTNGAIYNFTNSLYWTQTSDRRIKENIARASYDMCYDNIDKLELNRFNYIKEFNTGNKDTNQLGFIAQEIKEIFPKAVFTNNYSGSDLNIQDMLSIDIGQINYTLYGAVKKLMEINKDKEMRLKRLEGLLNIEDSGSSGNVVVDSSNAVVDSSNFVVDTSNLLDTSSNITIDTSNILDTPNITIDTSNITIDTSNILDTSSNISIDTINLLDTPNIAIDTSNILDTPNITIDTSNLLDTSSNI